MVERENEVNNGIRRIKFASLEDKAVSLRYKVAFSHLEDVPVSVTACLGYSVIRVADLLALEEGSVLELEKPLGQLVELFINDQKFGMGEVLVVNNRFAVRIQLINEIKNPGADGGVVEND